MTSRRLFLKKSSLAASAALLPVSRKAAIKKNKRILRIAHITDVHLKDEPGPRECFRRVLHELNTMKDRPDFIINTGDSVFESNGQPQEDLARRWAAWQTITRTTNRLPMYSALGNHDNWYGPKDRDAEYKSDPKYGKTWAIQELAMPDRYYTFTQRGWLFIGLDSITWTEDGYRLDAPQMQWLAQQLAATPASTPICIFSHVPILGVCPWTYAVERAKQVSHVGYPGGDMHTDAKALKDLFKKHANVKLCLSGHVHYIDNVDYLGVTYLCNGAVSGNWWAGQLDEFPPSYALLDFHEDGSVTSQTIVYDWHV